MCIPETWQKMIYGQKCMVHLPKKLDDLSNCAILAFHNEAIHKKIINIFLSKDLTYHSVDNVKNQAVDQTDKDVS